QPFKPNIPCYPRGGSMRRIVQIMFNHRLTYIIFFITGWVLFFFIPMIIIDLYEQLDGVLGEGIGSATALYYIYVPLGSFISLLILSLTYFLLKRIHLWIRAILMTIVILVGGYFIIQLLSFLPLVLD